MDSPPSHPNLISTNSEESPLFSDLSPLKSVKASHSGFALANLSSPPPVFMSPCGHTISKSMERYSQSDSRPHNIQEEDLGVNTKSFGICGLQQNKGVEMTNNNIKLEQYETQEADQRGINVSRHLSFGATMGYNTTGNETRGLANSSSPKALPHVRSMVPYQNEPSRISSSLHIPARFGLPFSNITRSLSLDTDITPFKLVADQIAQEQTQGKDLEGISNSSVNTDVYAPLQDYQPDSRASSSLGSDIHSIIKIPPQSDSSYFMRYDNRYDVNILTSPNTDNFEELNKTSPKRNRKRVKDLIDEEDCKNCNCKRSKCLKLYCECFAAGVYCLDTCACENCFNRPEYEDTVLDTRQQIETRNPLAFAPKVVKPTASTPSNLAEEASWTTSPSARHKRGCNCKKSKCLKKYCECYQAGVGCYNGCRCEDCNNSFGRKSESICRRRMGKWESPSHEQMDMFEPQPDFIDSGQALSLTSISQDQSKFSHKASSLLSSTAFNHQYSSDSSTPQLHGRQVLSEISPDGILFNMLEEDTIPGILRNTSTPLKLIRATSPNLKGVSPSQCQSQDMRSSSSLGFKSDHHSNLPPSP